MQTWPVGDCRRALVPQPCWGGGLVEEAVAPFDLPPCGCATTWTLMPIFYFHTIYAGSNVPRPVLVGLKWTTHTTHRQACARANA